MRRPELASFGPWEAAHSRPAEEMPAIVDSAGLDEQSVASHRRENTLRLIVKTASLAEVWGALLADLPIVVLCKNEMARSAEKLGVCTTSVPFVGQGSAYNHQCSFFQSIMEFRYRIAFSADASRGFRACTNHFLVVLFAKPRPPIELGHVRVERVTQGATKSATHSRFPTRRMLIVRARAMYHHPLGKSRPRDPSGTTGGGQLVTQY